MRKQAMSRRISIAESTNIFKDGRSRVRKSDFISNTEEFTDADYEENSEPVTKYGAEPKVHSKKDTPEIPDFVKNTGELDNNEEEAQYEVPAPKPSSKEQLLRNRHKRAGVPIEEEVLLVEEQVQKGPIVPKFVTEVEESQHREVVEVVDNSELLGPEEGYEADYFEEEDFEEEDFEEEDFEGEVVEPQKIKEPLEQPTGVQRVQRNKRAEITEEPTVVKRDVNSIDNTTGIRKEGFEMGNREYLKVNTSKDLKQIILDFEPTTRNEGPLKSQSPGDVLTIFKLGERTNTTAPTTELIKPNQQEVITKHKINTYNTVDVEQERKRKQAEERAERQRKQSGTSIINNAKVIDTSIRDENKGKLSFIDLDKKEEVVETKEVEEVKEVAKTPEEVADFFRKWGRLP